jgi:hypothetical protein
MWPCVFASVVVLSLIRCHRCGEFTRCHPSCACWDMFDSESDSAMIPAVVMPSLSWLRSPEWLLLVGLLLLDGFGRQYICSIGWFYLVVIPNKDPAVIIVTANWLLFYLSGGSLVSYPEQMDEVYNVPMRNCCELGTLPCTLSRVGTLYTFLICLIELYRS